MTTDPSTTPLECPYCGRTLVNVSGHTNHVRGCVLNPARRPQKRRTRKLCPKCRTLVDAGQLPRHEAACKGRRDEELLPEPILVTEATTPYQSTSELLVELLFPRGMPTHPDFVRAFREWLDATDKLVAIAGMDNGGQR